jgi:hypothetical protein
MIIAQERSFLKAQKLLEDMVQFVRDAGEKHCRVDEVEREVFRGLLAVGHCLLQEFIRQAGKGDEGKRIERDGQPLVRLKARTRRYLSIFGEIKIPRFVYARREGQKIEHVPTDARLGLPEHDFSYVLEDWLQRLCLKESFQEAVTSLESLLGLATSTASAERMNQKMAEHAELFRMDQPPPDEADEGEILVATSDGKGVPMRRPLEQRIAPTRRRRKGEKANRKQMAYVGAVYSIDRFRRTADDVIDEVFRKRRGEARPIPQNKRVWAEMTRQIEDLECNGRTTVFGVMSDEVRARNRGRRKPVVCLLDGERALWEAKHVWFGEEVVGILDLFHVMERLWGAAYCFHREGSADAEQFVTQRLRMLLEGRVGAMIGGLRRMQTRRRLKGERARTLTAAIRYFENNRQHMKYDEYLAAGYPIGSGVAEGACRHVVKDRMEQTGMRWTVDGAQAMLYLRSIYLNSDWDEFVEYRIQAEQTTLYGKRAA